MRAKQGACANLNREHQGKPLRGPGKNVLGQTRPALRSQGASCRSKAVPNAMDLESCAIPYEMRLARDGHAYKEPG